MTLKERLGQLRGRRVKIGGGVGTASGFFYCGESFDGIEILLKELSKDEEWRISNSLAKATRIYDSRDARWTARMRTAEEDLALAQKAVAERTATKDALADLARRAQVIVFRNRDKERTTNAQRLLRKFRSKLENEKFFLNIAQKDLQRKESINRTVHTAEAKSRQYKAWKKARDNYRAELNAFKSLAETEVIEDRRSIIDPMERILIIKSSIGGQYWYDEECDDDIVMQWKIRRARSGREDTI